MDSPDPYDLTRIKPHPEMLIPPELLPKLPAIMSDISRNVHVKSHFIQQRRISDQMFDDLFEKLNEPVLRGINEFVEKSLYDKMFENNSIRIHAATLLLDMQTSDHDTTISMIEQDLKEKHTKKDSILSIQRIRSNLRRKRNLLEQLEISNQLPRLFIIIEQAETIDTCLAEALVGHLYQRLESDQLPTRVIMILFCVSTKLQDLPFDSMSCFGKMVTIKKDTDLDRTIIKQHLLRSKGLTMKLHSKILDVIYDCYTNTDASIANVKLMFNYALHQHCARLLSKKNYKIIASENSSFAKEVKYNHEFLCDQLSMYYELFRGTGEFPNDVTDLYRELFQHEDLAQSNDIYESINIVTGLQPEALSRRLMRIKYPSEKYENCITDVFEELKSILENNDENSNLRTKQRNLLMNHAKSLKNPIKQHLRDAYFTDYGNLVRGMIESSRRDFEESFQPANPYFEEMCKKIFTSTAMSSADSIWGEIEGNFRALVRGDHKIEDPKEMTNDKLAPRTESRRLRKRRSAEVLKDDKDDKEDDKDDPLIHGLAKSVFLDLLSTMEHQHIIKLQRRGGKGLMIKRAVWLT